ncbi:MAG: class IIb bacteriocin, lactobin A/cerein 7B family [Nostoc sp.]|uniref:class IIb bacteriocin, lactobin A/cerein 7B family n=1 Tax=Nostoc sp. TaxID=1180 RepID=UPI002FFA7626
MAKITISDIDISSDAESLMIALTEYELESTSGGIIQLLIIVFGVGYAIGTGIAKALDL